MARVSYVDEEDLPEEYQGRRLTQTVGDPDDLDPEYRHLLSGSQRNVHRLFATLPPAQAAFRELAYAVWDATGFDPVERELTILATARALDCRYVWHQHVRIALDAGVPRERLLAVSRDDREALDDDHRALVDYAAAFVRGDVDDAVHAAVVERYDESAVVGICFLSGLYLLVCRSMDALDVDLEEPFVGWELEGADRER